MTITQQDHKAAETTMNPFGAQDDIIAVLPNVVQNMLREFSERKDVPEDLTISERRARKVCDCRDIGSYTLDIDSRLTSEISNYPFKATYEDNLGINDLRDITKNKNVSLPIVQLTPAYYEDCVGYTVQSDKYDGGRDNFTLVMKVNHNYVLIYDPRRFRNTNGQKMEATEIPQDDFMSAWLGELNVTSSLWIEPTDQKRISQY
ncbi:hypothetical protein [Halocalculus aciditolerans]|uniref:Uncharacterized protein n=1 Tax=Halocalculus aciditolerans TaxID=1383812 RepID=A0A830FJ26_9EURY|nr:hypothetical protein [Halocalculus aciditolerans]GGL57708.1 hypothetical protein GCM10009039_14860 [Halocalculus aciditolerans]